ncbi:MAG TPA: nitrate ABC transporter [Cyanobacteria bacterium UBA8803]|nr:nitrate ABC transporter [Cyanobacteria bacterium UBA9273]HBL58462.1 nitrate ABC transporter [Cyanobacteria bacterium UBA8803]
MRRFTLPIRLLLVAIAFLTCILVSCVQEPLKPLRIATNLWPGYEPLHLARDLGYYGKTPIQIVEYASNTERVRAYRNGDVEITSASLNTVLEIAETNPDTRILLVVDFSDGADAIVAKPEIGNLQDLKGRNIGLESSTLGVFLLTRGLEKAGLSIEDVKTVPMEIPEQEEAFKQGRVDAVVTYGPARSNLLAAGAKSLFDTSQIPGEIVDTLIGREELLTRYTTQLQVLGHAWFQALDYIKKNPEDAARRIAQRQGVTTEQFKKSLNGVRFLTLQENQQLLDKSDISLLNGAKRLSEFMAKNKLLQQKQDPTPLLDHQLVSNIKL